MSKEAFNKIANELHRHWIESVEQTSRSDGEIETFVVCSCGEWVLVAVAPSEGDPVFEFTKHCTGALFEIPFLAITALRDDLPPTMEHGYTCGMCSWGREDQPRSYIDYLDHLKSEHPDWTAKASHR